jgi:capsid protein
MASYQQFRKGGIFVPQSYSHYYEAARPSRKRKWMPILQQDSDKVLTPSVLKTLRSGARQLYTKSGFVRGAFRDVSRYLVGNDGIRPQSMAKDQGWAREIEARWLNWLKISDVFRKLHFNQLLRASSHEMDIDGDWGLVLTETGGGNDAPGMAQIQAVRGHRIDDDGKDANVFAGVVKDRNGRVAAYRIRAGADDGKFRDVPVSSFILLGDPDLTDYTRYPSAIAHGINLVVDARDIHDAVIVGLKARTGRAMVIKTPDGLASEDDYDKDEADAAELGDLTLEEIESGEILRLGPGEEIQELDSAFPGNQVEPMMEFSYRDFALGYGPPLEVIYGKNVGGPAQRFFISKFQRMVDERRGLIYVPRLCFPLWGYFVSKEMKRGAIPYNEDWWKVRFVATSPKASIDYGREARENREDIILGSRTLEEDAGERGLDWEEMRDQVEREAADLLVRAKRLALEFDIDLPLAMSLISRRTPNGNLPTGPVEKQSTRPLE